jgi:pyruvate formate lyase activating enzyme
MQPTPRLARKQGAASVAFTYNEPTIFAEYVIDAARACRRQGVATVMVTNGYITPEALDDVYPWIDAANVDLKAFTEDFYRKVTASHLQPVLDAIVRMRGHGTWVELTTLLIPGMNDGEDELRRACAWILQTVGDQVPIHFTAFHPDYKLIDRPRTPATTLFRARQIARDAGLKYVYCGNVRDDESHTTFCPSCHASLIRRDWHVVIEDRLTGTGRCACGQRIAGVWQARDEVMHA